MSDGAVLTSRREARDMLRIVKILLVLSVGAWALLGLWGNLADWNSFPNPEIRITIVAYNAICCHSRARGATTSPQVALEWLPAI